MKKIFTLLFLSLAATSVMAESKLVINVQLSPAGSFQAVSETLEGELIKKKDIFSASKIIVTVESLKTGIDLRDEHLWKHMNYAKFGNAILTDLKGQGGKASAQLEVAGVKKLVQITYKEKGDHIVGEFKLHAHDFKLPPAEYLGIGVDDEVVAEVTMPYKKI